jgi:hypothetical protein
MDEAFFIPKKRFRAVVQEVAAEIKRGNPSHFDGEYRWESDALVCLQVMSEHVLLMIFELWYLFFFTHLLIKSKIGYPCETGNSNEQRYGMSEGYMGHN